MTGESSGREISSRQNILRVIGTLIALALLFYLLSKQGWIEIWKAVQNIPLWRLGLAMVFMAVSRLAVTLRWHVLLHSARLKISFWQSLKITFAGLFATNFLPTTIGGDVVRLTGAIRLHLDGTISAASLIADRLVGMAGMGIALPFSIPAWISLSQSSMPSSNAIILGVTLPSFSWLKKFRQLFSTTVHKLMDSLAIWLKNPASLVRSLGWSFVHMICFFLILQNLLGAVGEKMSIWTVAGLYSLVYFVTLIPISINGYGLQEISMTLIFSNLGKASLGSGLTVALLFRTITMLISLPGAAFLPELLTASVQPGQDSKINPTQTNSGQ